MANPNVWTPAQLDMLIEFYPDHGERDLVQMIGRSSFSIYNQSHKLNIKKSKQYSKKSKSSRSRFKKGVTPYNHKPVGSIRIRSDGYVMMKMSEGKYKWEFLQHVIWNRMNGDIPEGSILVCIDGNKENLKVSNWSVYTRKQYMQRNTYHNYPKELAHLIQLKGVLTRQANKRSKDNEQ